MATKKTAAPAKKALAGVIKTAEKTIAESAAKPVAKAVRAAKVGDFGVFVLKAGDIVRGRVMQVEQKTNGTWLHVRIGAKPAEHKVHIIRVSRFVRDSK